MSLTSYPCRSCGAGPGQLVLDLGVQPLANRLLRPEDLAKPEPRFPLHLFVCPSCWLLQLAELVSPAELFSEYVYFSSYSEAVVEHGRQAADRYISELGLGAHSFVVEIASNDGYLVRSFRAAGVPHLGIEPAANVAQVARDQDIDTLVAFFDSDLAERLANAGQRADLILGNNVFAHVPTPNDFVAGLGTLLKPAGRIVLEFPYLLDFLHKTEFDTVYHEHVFYFSLTALRPLFERHGLEIIDVERLAIHGGSLRLIAAHRGAFSVRATVSDLLAEESRRGVTTPGAYAGFAAQVAGVRDALHRMLDGLEQRNQTLAAYGASAKGSTLLNYCGLDHRRLAFVADRSPHKQGRLTPGTHIPIVAAEELARRRPDYTLLLTWNLADEILSQQQAYRSAGGKFIIPIPRPIIL